MVAGVFEYDIGVFEGVSVPRGRTSPLQAGEVFGAASRGVAPSDPDIHTLSAYQAVEVCRAERIF